MLVQKTTLHFFKPCFGFENTSVLRGLSLLHALFLECIFFFKDLKISFFITTI